MPTGVYPRRPAVERLLEKVDRQETTGCWLWTGGKANGGYGVLWSQGRLQPAYRVAYQLLVGPIPEGLDLDHLCRTPACVNPAHLEPVTHLVNVQRALPFRANQRTTVCRAGHPRTPENTYVWPNGKGRNCRPCVAEAQRRFARRNAA